MKKVRCSQRKVCKYKVCPHYKKHKPTIIHNIGVIESWDHCTIRDICERMESTVICK